jgi:hypothetical protein
MTTTTNGTDLAASVAALLDLIRTAAIDAPETLGELSERYAKANRTLTESRIAENSIAIETAKLALGAAIRASVDASGLGDLVGKAVTGITYTVNPGTAGNGSTYSLTVSHRVRDASSATNSAGPQVKGRTMVTRTVDGVVETLKAGEVCVAYANDELRAMKAYSNRQWGFLFPKVNATLAAPFAPVPDTTYHTKVDAAIAADIAATS